VSPDPYCVSEMFFDGKFNEKFLYEVFLLYDENNNFQ
jgi:hypothetical protein